jgi:hypothetical protein
MIAARHRRARQRIPNLKCRGSILVMYEPGPCRPETIPQGMKVWSVALPNLLRGHDDRNALWAHRAQLAHRSAGKAGPRAGAGPRRGEAHPGGPFQESF